MKTHLEDPHNNKKVKVDNGKLEMSELISSIEFRIAKHREFQKKDKQVIIDNADFPEIVKDALERILERNIKIKELKEFIEYSLSNSRN
jgi:hypothetical protein